VEGDQTPPRATPLPEKDEGALPFGYRGGGGGTG